MIRSIVLTLAFGLMAGISPLSAQAPTELPALRGLAPVTVLMKSYAGKAALGANYAVTGGIQAGTYVQPTLLPLAEERQQALRDVFITDGDLAQLADGLGTTLGAAYLARAHYIDRTHYTSISQGVADLIAYTDSVTETDSNAGKYFFANQTSDGTHPVGAEATAIMQANGGTADIFGRSYGHLAGSMGAGRYGDARPFQTEPSLILISGPDYFSTPADNEVYSRGPMMDLTNSPSYPSGHTTYGYMGSLLLAVLVPQRYQQMIARGAEYGNSRIIVGAHYVMDVLGGRTLAMYDLAHLLANDPIYLNRGEVSEPHGGNAHRRVPNIGDFRAAVLAARTELQQTLEAGCGKPVAVCAVQDNGRFSDAAADEAFYLSTQTYAIPVVYPAYAAATEDVRKLAPEAGYLLTVAFPSLTLDQADNLLTETEGPGGGFLDNGSPFGLYSRLNLYAAAARAAQMEGKAPVAAAPEPAP
jgi:hypothetical protein